MEVEEGRVDAVADPENPKVPLFRASLPFKSPNSMNALPLTSPSLPPSKSDMRSEDSNIGFPPSNATDESHRSALALEFF